MRMEVEDYFRIKNEITEAEKYLHLEGKEIFHAYTSFLLLLKNNGFYWIPGKTEYIRLPSSFDDFEFWSHPEVPRLLFEKKNCFTGVYFIFPKEKTECEYIGKSRNGYRRIWESGWCDNLDHLFWLECSSDEEAFTFESFYIQAFQPTRNLRKAEPFFYEHLMTHDGPYGKGEVYGKEGLYECN